MKLSMTEKKFVMETDQHDNEQMILNVLKMVAPTFYPFAKVDVRHFDSLDEREDFIPKFNDEILEEPIQEEEINFEEAVNSYLPKEKDTKFSKAYEPTEKLVFMHCDQCDTTFCKMVDLSDPRPVYCRECNNHITVNPHDLHFGKYECSCGTHGRFLMQDNVSIVKCKNKECNNEFFMVKDEATGDYIGKEMTI